MLRTGLLAAFCAGLTLLSSMCRLAEARSPTDMPQPLNIVTIQWPGGPNEPGSPPDWAVRRQQCEQMRQTLHDIGNRMQDAPPWEREQMAGQFYQIRERLRAECSW